MVIKKTESYSWLVALMVTLASAAWTHAASTIEFTTTSYTTNESAGTAALTVQRTGDSSTGALRDVQIWAGYNGGSDPVTDASPSLDLTLDQPGLDTVVTRYTNSPPGGAVELWTIIGGSHHPALSSQFSRLVIDWLFAIPNHESRTSRHVASNLTNRETNQTQSGKFL